MKKNKSVKILIFFLLLISSSFAKESKSVNILFSIYVKNTNNLISNIQSLYENLSNNNPYHFSIILDSKDKDFFKTKRELEKFHNLTIFVNENNSQIRATNENIKNYIDWFDIAFILDNNFELLKQKFDQIVVEQMVFNYPDFDGVLNFSHNTLEYINNYPIIGKKYYLRFNYVYNEIYNSSYFDKEFTCVSRILAKETIVRNSFVIKKNQSNIFCNLEDEQIFDLRRQNIFGIDNAKLKDLFPKKWSILICTLEERKKQFQSLCCKLYKQILDNNLQDEIEILYFNDNRQFSVGFKRNELIKKSKGMYINFLDDDDDIHENYIKMIYEKLKSGPDCVSLVGIIIFNKKYATYFVHSIEYDSYFQKNNIYYRPPNHVNTMKRSIASQFIFPDIFFSEDINWAMQIAKSKLLLREEKINIPYYFYDYISNK